MTVDLFVPCFVDQFSPNTALNAIKILEKCGLTVNYNPEQTCCGKDVFEAGFWDEAKELGEKLLKDFPGDNKIVCLSTSCVSYIQSNFQTIFYNSGSHLEYKKMAARSYEFTDFLVNELNAVNFGSVFEHKVTYHDSCYALRKYRYCIKEEPRVLLKNIQGLELVELNDDDCCGFGGLFSLKHSSISTAMVEAKVRKALDLGVTHIISADCGCLINLNSYIERHNLPLQVMHIADVLAEGI
ncbi:MAG: (Fe-S)-binding protein [Bacteroidales bacterium]|jgi:L-lactate dehydrogenase complex protein LldE|nr:(Fe-S)-binding protein [Bacteroidales bacterium]MDD3153088.1 (Fe-S)-binding protein [Bacteroidales bacterium]MDD3914337.1 (Fe-S)-binding protein [Bacteroidales bacterium]MDD4634114.1 (Fe-S)-binding protein [Bacteroidales bacterium]